MAVPHLPDHWARRPIYLDGPLERRRAQTAGGADIAFGVGGLVAAFVVFQFVVSPLALTGLLAWQGVTLGELLTDGMDTLLQNHARELLIGNSAGQLVGLGLMALCLARLHARRVTGFLRLRQADGRLIVLSIVGLVALTPVVQWLGAVNQSLPLPESIRALEQSQIELIQSVLGSDLGLFFNLTVLALVPAVCEELLFRGYAQREFERGGGAAFGIAASGVLFGLYHLRLSQVLPLTALGLYIAYLAWRTGSLWPPVLVHFANNAFAVVAAYYVSSRPDLDTGVVRSMDVPGLLVVGGALGFAGICYLLHTTAARLQANVERDGPSSTAPPGSNDTREGHSLPETEDRTGPSPNHMPSPDTSSPKTSSPGTSSTRTAEPEGNTEERPGGEKQTGATGDEPAPGSPRAGQAGND
jgi:hypothetical protein